jgi:argininosuccinate lyase
LHITTCSTVAFSEDKQAHTKNAATLQHLLCNRANRQTAYTSPPAAPSLFQRANRHTHTHTNTHTHTQTATPKTAPLLHLFVKWPG